MLSQSVAVQLRLMSSRLKINPHITDHVRGIHGPHEIKKLGSNRVEAVQQGTVKIENYRCMVWYKGCDEEGGVVVVEGQGGAVDGVGYGFEGLIASYSFLF
jgi:hypothetical protein